MSGPREHYDAIVIGSGIGGLACAAVLAAAGRRVLILEKQENPGGCLQSIPEPPDARGAGEGDWAWNMGIQYLAPMSTRIGPFTFNEIAWWPLLSEPPVRITRLGGPIGSPDEHTYQRLVLNGPRGTFEVRLKSDRDAMRKELLAMFGETGRDKDNIERFWRHLDTINDNVITLLLPKVLPWPLSRLAFPWATWPLAPLMDRTMKEVLGETFQGGAHDEEIKLVLSSYWNFLGFPLETNFMFWTIGMNLQMHGVWTPVGGSRPVIEGFVGMVEKHGGQLRHGPGGDVREVLLEGRWRPRAVGVRCADGTEVRAPVVVSSVGLPQTVGGLVPADAFPRRVRRAVRRHVSLPSNLMLRIGFGQGCDRALVEQAIGFATTFRWMEQGAWDMDQDPTAEDWVPDDVLVMFPEFYQAPPGSAAMQTCEVVFVTDHRFFRHWTDAKDPAYLAVIDRIAGKLRAFFDAKFPTLAPHVACSWMSHPLEIRDRIHHEGGSIYGLDSYKLIDQDILPRSGIPGLFLTGEDVVAHGVSISAGMTTAGVVLSGDIALGLLRWIGRTLLRSPLLALRMILPLGSTYRLPQHLMDEAHPRGRR